MRGAVVVRGFDARWMVGLLILTAIVGSASATVVSIHPDTIERGDTVFVDISQCTNGSLLSILVEGDFSVQLGGQFQFEAQEFSLPFSLDQGEVGAYAENVQWAGFSVKKGSTTISLTSDAVNGVVQATEAYNVSAGMYDFFRIEGIALPNHDHIVARFQLTGTKSGPDTSQISFTVDGINSGTITVAVYVNAQEVLQKRITMTIPPIHDGGSSGSGGIVPEPFDEETDNVTPTITTIQQVRTFTSVDGKVTLTVENVTYAGILKVEGDRPPSGWLFIGSAYAVSPSNLTFTPPGALSITLPVTANASTSTLTIAWRENGSWRLIPSRISGEHIIAMITSGGVYAVLTPAIVETTIVPTTSMTTMPPTTPTPTSSPPLVLVLCTILLAAVIAFVGWHRSRP